MRHLVCSLKVCICSFIAVHDGNLNLSYIQVRMVENGVSFLLIAHYTFGTIVLLDENLLVYHLRIIN